MKGWISSFLTLFLLVQPVNFLSRSLNLSSSSRKNDSGLLNRAFVQVQPEKMSYRKMPSHFRPPAPVSPAAATALPGRSLAVQPFRSEGWSSELLHRHAYTLRAVFTPRLADAEPEVSFYIPQSHSCGLLSMFGPGFPHGNSHPLRNLVDCSGSKANLPLSSGHSSGQQQGHLFAFQARATLKCCIKVKQEGISHPRVF